MASLSYISLPRRPFFDLLPLPHSPWLRGLLSTLRDFFENEAQVMMHGILGSKSILGRETRHEDRVTKAMRAVRQLSNSRQTYRSNMGETFCMTLTRRRHLTLTWSFSLCANG